MDASRKLFPKSEGLYEEQAATDAAVQVLRDFVVDIVSVNSVKKNRSIPVRRACLPPLALRFLRNMTIQKLSRTTVLEYRCQEPPARSRWMRRNFSPTNW